MRDRQEADKAHLRSAAEGQVRLSLRGDGYGLDVTLEVERERLHGRYTRHLPRGQKSTIVEFRVDVRSLSGRSGEQASAERTLDEARNIDIDRAASQHCASC